MTGMRDDTEELAQPEIEAGDISDASPSGHSGASIFDPVLCELCYLWFSPPGGLVLDPFAGGSVRGIIASRLGRRYIGVDLRPEQIEANKAQADLATGPAPVWRVGDSRNIKKIVGARTKADFIFSCPPYANLEVYSDDPADLSAMDYPAFREAYFEIIRETCALLKPDRFAVFLVGDVRGKDGMYYGLPEDTVLAFREAGLGKYNEAILVTAVGSLPIRAARAFEHSRKLGKTHQNLLIFCKGDPVKATAAIGPVEFDRGEDEDDAASDRPGQSPDGFGGEM